MNEKQDDVFLTLRERRKSVRALKEFGPETILKQVQHMVQDDKKKDQPQRGKDAIQLRIKN